MRYSRILQYVNQVARTGSIRKAAEQLNATSTAVNKRIKDLEDELEVELFDRTPRGVSLTAAGEMFIHFVREQLSEEDRMRSRLDEMRGLRRGLVRIATSQALAGNFMPDLLAGFKKRSPNVAFHVLAATHSQAISALEEHEVELVLIYRPPRTYKLEPIFSINQRLMAVMNRNHPLVNHPSLRLRDFAKYPVALPDGTIGRTAAPG
jgi:DNA-binding transcriptional LysR family regulator